MKDQLVVQLLLQPHVLIAVILPTLFGMFFFELARQRTPLTPRMALQLFLVVAFGCMLNASFSFWSDRGLHVVSLCSVVVTVWCLKTRHSLLLVYPATFIGILFADLIIALDHPDYPFGIGGAGFFDSLFVSPIAFTAVAFMLNKSYNGQYENFASPACQTIGKSA